MTFENDSKCSLCGITPVNGCEVAIKDGNGDMKSFCDYDCLAVWNLQHGLGPTGEVFQDDRLGGRCCFTAG